MTTTKPYILQFTDCCIEVLQWSSDGMFIALADATGGISIISSASFETVVKEKLPNIDISEKECAGSKPFFCSISFVHQKGLYQKVNSKISLFLFLKQDEHKQIIEQKTYF